MHAYINTDKKRKQKTTILTKKSI